MKRTPRRVRLAVGETTARSPLLAVAVSSCRHNSPYGRFAQAVANSTYSWHLQRRSTSIYLELLLGGISFGLSCGVSGIKVWVLLLSVTSLRCVYICFCDSLVGFVAISFHCSLYKYVCFILEELGRIGIDRLWIYQQHIDLVKYLAIILMTTAFHVRLSCLIGIMYEIA
jgi:hypothetical protein